MSYLVYCQRTSHGKPEPQCERSGNVSSLCSEGARFESLPDSRQTTGQYFEVGYDRFLPIPFKFMETKQPHYTLNNRCN